MVQNSKEKKRLEFALEEIGLSFLGALLITYSMAFLSNAGFTTQAGLLQFGSGLLAIWVGLLLFIIPLVRAIENLM